MNRRKAIIQISIAGIGVLAAAGGYKWYSISKAPDVAYLKQNIPLLSALAETIIPSSAGSPGAAETGTGSFILTMIRDCTIRKEQNNFIDGLKDLQNYSVNNYGNKFESCQEADQITILEHFEGKGKTIRGIAGKAKNRYLGRSFFTILKSYTVEGYCTSEAGATRALAYSHIPGSYQGCVNMEPGQRVWATN